MSYFNDYAASRYKYEYIYKIPCNDLTSKVYIYYIHTLTPLSNQ